MEWINSQPKIPIGLKYSDSETYIEFDAFPKEKKALLSMMNPINIDELMNLLEPILLRLEKEYDIELIYQAISNNDLSQLINTKWKEIENELIIVNMNESYKLVGCKIDLFKKNLFLALN